MSDAYEVVEHHEGTKTQFCVYFDYTGAGRGPEPIAGPFPTSEEAAEWIVENDFYFDNYVFVDECRGED